MRSLVFKLALAVMALATFAWAQSYNLPAPNAPAANMPAAEEDTAGPGVARISIQNGDVSVRRGDSGELVAAALNAPLMAGDHLVTGPNGKAEIQFDYGNMVRLDANTEVILADLDNQVRQIQVAAGAVDYRILRDAHLLAEIDTPSVSVRPSRPGSYRVSVDPDGQSVITVRLGEADIFTPQGSQPLQAGQTMYARGSADNPEFKIVAALAPDAFDAWNEESDQRLEGSNSYRYVSPDIAGAEDLDANGRWVSTPDYGQVWAPTVGPDWAPYQNGNWVWEDYYGWTWMGVEPWAWAPYHYGRWFRGAYGWCWYPGPIGARNFWRPALVGFFGFGRGIGIGFGFGSIGWVPLAPFELFHPWYGGFGWRGGFGSHMNIVNNVNIAGAYRNARVAGAVHGSAVGEFGRGVGARILPVSGSQLGQAGAIHGVLPVTPSAGSLHFSNRQATATGLSHTASAQRFAMQHRPAASSRTSFQEQQRGMEKAFGSSATAAGRSASFGAAAGSSRASGTVPAARSAAGQTSSRGWHPFVPAGRPGTVNNAGSSARSLGRESAPQRNAASSSVPRTTAPSSGWRPFNASPAQSERSGYSGSRGAAPAYQAPRYEAPRSAAGGQIHISPPIVRERSTTGSSVRNQSYGGGSAASSHASPAPSHSSGDWGHSSSASSHTSSGHSSSRSGHK
jgi:hypothetical protein